MEINVDDCNGDGMGRTSSGMEFGLSLAHGSRQKYASWAAGAQNLSWWPDLSIGFHTTV